MKEGRQYIAIDRVLEKVQRDNPWMDGLNFYDACDYLDEVFGLIGAPGTYIDRVTGDSLIRPHVKIQDYAGELPVDFIELKAGGVREVDNDIVYRRSSDSFVKSPASTGERDQRKISDRTYYIEDGYIYTNQDDVTLQLAYRAVPVDERGFPMLPDTPKFIEAVKWYITEREAWKKWSVGKLADKVWNEIAQNSIFYQGAAASESKMPDPERMETFKNMYVRLYPRVDFHQSSFKFAGVQEDIQTGYKA